jgi:uncharacterized protein (TIGR02118 family)
MTHKLIILFKRPADPADFQRRWSEEFVPLAEQLPGLRRITVSVAHGGPAGSVDVHLIHELHFDTLEAVKAAMAAPEGLRAGRCLVDLAGQRAELVFAEHMEDAPRLHPAASATATQRPSP